MAHVFPLRMLPLLLVGALVAIAPAPPVSAQPGFWVPLNAPEGGVVQCFTATPQGSILAGTYFGGIFRTTDRGGTWSHLPGTTWDTRAIMIAPNGTWFVGAAASGVWKSTDGGTTWSRPANILNGRTVTSLAYNLAGDILAGCQSTSSQSVYRSTDGGETFFLASALVLSANGLIRSRADTLFCAGDRFGIIISSNGGSLWTRINPSASNFDGLAVASNSRYLFLVGRRSAATTPESSFVYRMPLSTGLWELVRVQSGATLRTIAALGDTLTAAGGSALLVSFDAGQSWVVRNPSSGARGGRELRPPISSYLAHDIQLLGTAGESVQRSTSFWGNWLQSNRGLTNTHIVAGTTLSGNRAVVSAQFDGLFLIDGTMTTRIGAGLPNDDVVSALASDGEIVYAGTANNGLYRSTDAGGTFTRALFGSSASGILTISTKTPPVVRAGGRGEFMHTSTDRGVNWSSDRLPAGVVTNITGIRETGGGEVFVGTGPFGGTGSGNGVYRTTTGGTSWNQWGLTFTSVISLDLAEDNSLLAGTALSQIYEGTTSSTVWTLTPAFQLPSTLRTSLYYSYQSQPLRELAGTSTGLYDRVARTTDPWQRRTLNGWEIAYADIVGGDLFLGTYGNGVHRSTGPLTFAESDGRPLPSRAALLQNYPNPFNPSTTIEFDLPVRETVLLEVYDLLGSRVATLVEGVLEAGHHAVRFRPGDLASGVYICRLRAGGFTGTTRLVLVR